MQREFLHWTGVIGAAFLTLAPIVSASAAPRDPARAAAVFPPWWTAMQAGAAAGDVAGMGGAPFVVIVRGAPETLTAQLRQAGAWLILEPNSFGLCEAKEPAQ